MTGEAKSSLARDLQARHVGLVTEEVERVALDLFATSGFSNVTVAVVRNSCAVSPAFPSWPDKAIVKHPAWAAAISSSGFVPLPLSNRVLNEYCVLDRIVLSVETVPLPVFRSPCHSADACRFI